MKNNRPKYQQTIDAAVKVIAENGYHASQVSRIASEAGVANGIIYLYFKNKEDVLISIFEEKMGKFIEEIAKETSGQPSTNEKLRKLIDMHFYQLENNYDLAIVTQLELRQSNVLLRHQINKVLKSYLKVIDGIIEQGKKEKRFRDDIQIKLLRQMIFGTLDEVVTNWVIKERKYKLGSQVTEIHKFLTEGLRKM